MLLISILIVIIIALMVINYVYQKDFVSPTFLSLASFLMATVLILLNYDNWNININGKFFAVVLLALGSLILGSYIIRIRRNDTAINTETFHRIDSKKINFNAFFIKKYPRYTMLIVSFILFIVFTILLVKEIGFNGSFSAFLRSIYDSKFATEGGHFVFHQVEKIIIAIAYVNYFHLMNLIFFFNKKNKKKNKKKEIIVTIIPILLAMVCVLLSTDRNIIIRFFIYALALWIMFFQRRPRRTIIKSNRIILIFTAFIFVAMVLAFYAMGKMKQYTSNLERMVGIYGGSGLYNFNLYLADFDGVYTYGLATFKGLLNSLSSLGIVSGDLVINDLDFIIFKSNSSNYVYASNIYSSLQPFYQDFGFVGIILFMLFIGFFFEYFYQKTFKYKYGYGWVMYAAFLYPTIFLSIADQFYARLHLGLLYEIFWLTVIYFITYGKYTYKYKNLKFVRKFKRQKLEIANQEVAL